MSIVEYRQSPILKSKKFDIQKLSNLTELEPLKEEQGTQQVKRYKVKSKKTEQLYLPDLIQNALHIQSVGKSPHVSPKNNDSEAITEEV